MLENPNLKFPLFIIAINKKNIMEIIIIPAIFIKLLCKAFKDFTEGLKNLQTMNKTSSRKQRNKKRKKRRKHYS